MQGAENWENQSEMGCPLPRAISIHQRFEQPFLTECSNNHF